MSTFDKQQLVQYLETVIPHQDNPESFRYQIDTEISRVLKQQEHSLKTHQSKIRFNQILENDFQKREKLKRQLQEKTRKGIEHKQKLIAERAKSLVQLNKRRQLLQREKAKQNRKAQLLKSLKKIEEFQAKKRAIEQFKINRSMSDRALRSESRLNQIKEAAHDSQYNAIVNKLGSKGIFTLPSKQLQSIYSHKATYRNQSQKKLKKMEEKLGVSLIKIQEAHRKKEELLMQRSQKIHNTQKLQFQLKQGKWKELQAEEIKKRKELQIRQAKKILKAKAIQGGEYQRSLTQKDYEVEVQLGGEKVKVKNPSYREQIRKHIGDFLKGKHA